MSVTDRKIPLEGAFNFRDLGGYPTRDGRHVAWRRLFRADGLHRLSVDDLLQLDDLGIHTVIDLRTTGEVEEASMPEGPFTPAVHHLPMIDVLPPRGELRDWVDDAFLIDRYTHMLADGHPAIARAIRILASADAVPAVFHCTAGKDRTGILAAVVLGLLGVGDDDIVDDYSLSRAAMVEFLEHLRATVPPDVRADLDQRENAILAARPAVMAGLLAHIRDDRGGFDALAESIGVTDCVEPLQAALLD